ncbi:MAG: DNA polymerase III subunit alpha [Ignavibacteriae bacterium]|nr:DNA polymerase III subunit alpha [Ignavibacteriota bacterium]NOG99863.1 DNA polymerase III subunit alpha [Ignavibacteriota bacterium]
MLNLHNHSNYSLLQGTIPIDRLVNFAKRHKSSYISLTDTNGMYGLINFAQKAEEENIKPILGAVIDDPDDSTLNAVFIAKNNEGYSELCKLISARKLKDGFSLINIFKGNLENFFILTSSIELLKKIKLTGAIRKNIFAELIVTEKQKKHTRALYEFAKENKVQVAASHPAYFEKPEDFILHKVVTAIKQRSTFENIDTAKLVDEEYYLKSPKEFEQTWKALPEALWNIEHIAQNCNVDLEFGKYKFPVFPLPKNETSFSYLWKICFEGLGKKYKPITERAVKRLQYELEVIDELGFSDYFLVVWDIIREARNRQMISIGRGSAANSLVSYCLDFTQVDPLEHNLYFERFLNRARTSPPDIDLDFSWRERDEIVKYVYDKYGYDKVAMISTTVTFRARSAFRETAKVFGVSEREISKFSKLIPWTSAKNLPALAEKFPESKSLNFNSEPWKSIVNIASRLASFPRHLSIHASGIVVTEKPITNYVALEYAKNKGLGLIITQPDMYGIEDLGLIKIDLLSQRSLEVLKDTMNGLGENYKHIDKGDVGNIIPINSLDKN